ncbi:hypothetical protein DL93DRAFT_2233185 [Clavulina sp. PMI_390]|nr:hypothetical protein DL93DRAFT_2233185 [Clavulina sp. PMI_390]
MISAAFGVATEALNSLDGLLSSLPTKSTPVILYHPPCRRPAQTSTIQNNLAIFESYEDELSKLFQKISSMKNRLLRQRATCASALSPIAALPMELMREVFQLVADTSDSSLDSLAAVCSSWRMVALGQPALWTKVNSRMGDSLKRATTHYLRSGSFPLHLEVHDAWSDWSPALLKSLPGVENQLETLCWDVSADMEGFLNSYHSKSLCFKSLSTLTVSCSEICKACGTWWSNAEDQHGGLEFLNPTRFPALHNLEVRRVQLGLAPGIISQLEHLKLDCVPMMVNKCRKILSHARLLKTLIIKNASETLFFDEVEATPNETYVIPHLETIQLSSNPDVLMKVILESCRCPSLLTLQLSDVPSPGLDPSNHPFLDYLSSFLPQRYKPANDFLYPSTSTQLIHAPKLRDFVITRSNDKEICFLTTPLCVHAFQLKRLIFSTWEALKADSALLPHLDAIMICRQKAGASPLELETFRESWPILQNGVQGIHLVASNREDCTKGSNGLGADPVSWQPYDTD